MIMLRRIFRVHRYPTPANVVGDIFDILAILEVLDVFILSFVYT